MVLGDIPSDDYFKTLAETLEKIPSLKRIDLTETAGQVCTVSRAAALTPLLRLPLVEFRVDFTNVNWNQDAVTPLINSAFTHRPPASTLLSLGLPWKSTGSYSSSLWCLSYTAEKAPGLKELSLGLQSNSNSSTSGWTRPRFATIQSLLAHWKAASPSKSQLRYLAISEQKQLSQFNAEQYNDIAQLLDLMFPSLVSVGPYSEADRTAPYWKDHWWFIEHLRKMYKELRVLRRSN
jgi:hypothetical protein